MFLLDEDNIYETARQIDQTVIEDVRSNAIFEVDGTFAGVRDTEMTSFFQYVTVRVAMKKFKQYRPWEEPDNYAHDLTLSKIKRICDREKEPIDLRRGRSKEYVNYLAFLNSNIRYAVMRLPSESFNPDEEEDDPIHSIAELDTPESFWVDKQAQEALKRLLAALDECLAALDDDHRRILEAKFYSNLKIREIADVFGMKFGKANTDYERAKKKLLVCMKAKGFSSVGEILESEVAHED